jgi:hypothetical protein
LPKVDSKYREVPFINCLKYLSYISQKIHNSLATLKGSQVCMVSVSCSNPVHNRFLTHNVSNRLLYSTLVNFYVLQFAQSCILKMFASRGPDFGICSPALVFIDIHHGFDCETAMQHHQTTSLFSGSDVQTGFGTNWMHLSYVEKRDKTEMTVPRGDKSKLGFGIHKHFVTAEIRGLSNRFSNQTKPYIFSTSEVPPAKIFVINKYNNYSFRKYEYCWESGPDCMSINMR